MLPSEEELIFGLAYGRMMQTQRKCHNSRNDPFLFVFHSINDPLKDLVIASSGGPIVGPVPRASSARPKMR